MHAECRAVSEAQRAALAVPLEKRWRRDNVTRDAVAEQQDDGGPDVLLVDEAVAIEIELAGVRERLGPRHVPHQPPQIEDVEQVTVAIEVGEVGV